MRCGLYPSSNIGYQTRYQWPTRIRGVSVVAACLRVAETGVDKARAVLSTTSPLSNETDGSRVSHINLSTVRSSHLSIHCSDERTARKEARDLSPTPMSSKNFDQTSASAPSRYGARN